MKTLFLGISLLWGIFISPISYKKLYNSALNNGFYNYELKRIVQQPKSTPITIVNDEFVMRVLENDLEYYKIIRAEHPKNINKKIVQNKYSPTNKDTIVTFSVNKDTYDFYKGKQKVILQKMSLRSENIVLDKNIRIGCDKKLFKNKYDGSLKSDIAVIQDVEGGNLFTFIFKNNKLIQVTYKIEYIE
ncbi:MAG: hypothetical protein ACHQF4_11920 [Sphingobacteriales bacterium]